MYLTSTQKINWAKFDIVHINEWGVTKILNVFIASQLILLSFVDILVSPEFLLCNSRTSYINVKSTHFGLFYFILFKQSEKKIYRVLWPWNRNDILQFDEIASYCKRYFFSCLRMKSRTRSLMTFIVSFDMAWKEYVIQGDRRHSISWIWNFLD